MGYANYQPVYAPEPTPPTPQMLQLIQRSLTAMTAIREYKELLEARDQNRLQPVPEGHCGGCGVELPTNDDQNITADIETGEHQHTKGQANEDITNQAGETNDQAANGAAKTNGGQANVARHEAHQHKITVRNENRSASPVDLSREGINSRRNLKDVVSLELVPPFEEAMERMQDLLARVGRADRDFDDSWRRFGDFVCSSLTEALYRQYDDYYAGRGHLDI